MVKFRLSKYIKGCSMELKKKDFRLRRNPFLEKQIFTIERGKLDWNEELIVKSFSSE